jgi:hypothetical protein
MHDVVLGAIDGDGIVRGVHVLVRGPLADVRAGPLDQVLDIDLGGGVEAADGLDVAVHVTPPLRWRTRAGGRTRLPGARVLSEM